MSQLGVEVDTSRRGAETPTFMDLLRDHMDGQDRPRRRKRTLRERLGFKSIGCCGPSWSFRQSTLGARENEEEDEEIEEEPDRTRAGIESDSGMNLAAALAAERHQRVPSGEPDGNMTPLRVSLMRLLEETTEKESGRVVMTASVGNDSLCCVCMAKKKGAAFIPCGHTFCRVCSRELWLNRGSCPICNRPILEILDIY